MIEDSTRFFYRLLGELEWKELPVIKLYENESIWLLYTDVTFRSFQFMIPKCLALKLNRVICQATQAVGLWNLVLFIGDYSGVTDVENNEGTQMLPETYSLEQKLSQSI